MFECCTVLIESDWNLKEIQVAEHEQSGHDVLIESDWNLKLLTGVNAPSCMIVLIESDWNLKTFRFFPLLCERSCINRIRLEFKVSSELHPAAAAMY